VKWLVFGLGWYAVVFAALAITLFFEAPSWVAALLTGIGLSVLCAVILWRTIKGAKAEKPQ
jgi:uncharacterized protein (DUF983 family)